MFAKYKSGMTIAAFEKSVGKVRGSKRSPHASLLFDLQRGHLSVG